MKVLKYLTAIALVSLTGVSCKKEVIEPKIKIPPGILIMKESTGIQKFNH